MAQKIRQTESWHNEFSRQNFGTKNSADGTVDVVVVVELVVKLELLVVVVAVVVMLVEVALIVAVVLFVVVLLVPFCCCLDLFVFAWAGQKPEGRARRCDFNCW